MSSSSLANLSGLSAISSLLIDDLKLQEVEDYLAELHALEEALD
jgi:hypothetical protein